MSREINRKTDRLFVYGTLKRSHGHPMHRLLAEGATFIGPASTRGRLYRVSWYPALVDSSDPDDQVRGELYRMHDPVRLLPRLDEYEGIPSPPTPDDEYTRSRMTVTMEDGTRSEAWGYFFNHSVDDAFRIPSGVF